MSVLESIFYMIWRGIAIGVLISAPMGPVGILCIQRTLDRGRKAGLYTGIGAALSDLFYCLLTGFGLSFIEEFIERNQNIIQLFGSIVLIAFSVYLFRKNPSSSLRRPVPQGVSAKKNILGGFLFTFSNPLILFLIIGLFARFNFLMPEIRPYHYLIGYIFILGGALGWWYGVTYIIDKIRNRFSLKAMKGINIGIGIVILLFAAVGIVTSIIDLTSPSAKAQSVRYFNPRRGMGPFAADTVGAARMMTGVHSSDATVRLTVSTPDHLPGKWGLSAVCDTLTACFSFIAERPDDDYQPPLVSELRVSVTGPGGEELFAESGQLAESLSTGAGGPLRLRLSFAGGHLSLDAGKTGLRRIADCPFGFDKMDSVGVIVDTGTRLRLDDISIQTATAPLKAALADSVRDLAALSEYIAGFPDEDPLVGYWHLHDYEIEDDYVRLGGDYRLAIVPSHGGGYDIVYVNGARTCRQLWHPVDLKARLLPVENDGDTFDVIWLDASKKPVGQNIKARREPPGLSIDFPYCSSRIRLVKERIR